MSVEGRKHLRAFQGRAESFLKKVKVHSQQILLTIIEIPKDVGQSVYCGTMELVYEDKKNKEIDSSNKNLSYDVVAQELMKKISVYEKMTIQEFNLQIEYKLVVNELIPSQFLKNTN